MLPYPQYTSISDVYVPAGNSNYNAGTIQIQKRLSSTFTFMAAYTRSKAIDDARTPYDVYNRQWERAVSAFDTPNAITANAVYNLPFGHGRTYLNSINRYANAIIGGWDLSGILSIQSGHPIGISRSAISTGKSAKLDNPTIAQWFDTSQFTIAGTYGYGNVGPELSGIYNDGVQNVDVVLAKNSKFLIAEHKVNVQFRAEAYNVANHARFGSPDSSITSATFGQISSQANSPRDLQFGLKLTF